MANEKKAGVKKLLRLLRRIQKNDVVIQIYLSFAVLMTLTGVLIGVIFSMLYQRNYIRSYTELLTEQGQTISGRVSNFAKKRKIGRFEKYSTYIDELEQAENTDIWILSNDSASSPLGEDYVNAQVETADLSEEMTEALALAFEGSIASQSSYDKVYGMTTLFVTVPIRDKQTGEIVGAVMLVSMLDRQTLGLREGKYMIAFSVALAVLLSYFVSVLFSRFLSRPLERVGSRIGELAGGDYSKKQVKRPHSQIGILEKSLNELSYVLRRTEEQRDKLEQARRDFFANVSHELRTPITVMRGYTETLVDGVLEEPEQVTEMYQRMLQECQGMERLVGDLFILSKMQNPDFEIEKEPVSLAQIFSDVLRSAGMVGKEKGISFSISLPEDDPCLVLGDYGRLRQMFMVIVDNAVKFSKEGGRVEIAVEKEAGSFLVSIRDYGVGISEEELPYIFEKFYTSKMRQNQKGTGLGLMIAKEIALRHGGQIRVESKKGEGTVFFFRFEECTCADDFA